MNLPRVSIRIMSEEAFSRSLERIRRCVSIVRKGGQRRIREMNPAKSIQSNSQRVLC